MSLFKLYVVENSVLVCMGFNQYNLGHHLPCLMGPKFYAAELKVLENKIQCVQVFFYGRINSEHYLNKLSFGPQGKATNKYQAAELSSSGEEF